MGLRFRKSSNAGPFRVNFSKSGVGYSVGGKGFRFTKKANGGYRTTASIPGTGLSYTKDSSGKKRSDCHFSEQDQHNAEIMRKKRIVGYFILGISAVLIVICFALLWISSTM